MASSCLKLTPLNVGQIDNTSSSVCDRIRPPIPCPKVPIINDQRRFCTIKCHASSTFPSYIQVPEIKYEPSKDSSSTYALVRGILTRLDSVFGDETEKRDLYTFGLRMTIRDDDGVLEKKLAPLSNFYYDWRYNTNCISMFLQRNNIDIIFKDISSRLLEHADSWICGYSFVLYDNIDYKFGLELLKLEPVLSLYASGGYSDTNVRSVEIFLKAGIYGPILDHNIHTRKQLIELLRYLNNLKVNGGDSINPATVVPVVFNHFLSKERLDQLEGYAHICLGNFR